MFWAVLPKLIFSPSIDIYQNLKVKGNMGQEAHIKKSQNTSSSLTHMVRTNKLSTVNPYLLALG